MARPVEKSWNSNDSTVHAATQPGPDWDRYVAAHSGSSIYHRSAWVLFVREVFGQEVWFLKLFDAGGHLAGVLPLIRQKGPVSGSFMTSLPYFNYGGPLANTAEGAIELMTRARELAREQGCRYLELRDTDSRSCGWPVRTDKVSMVLDLPADAASLASQLGSKMRSQIRRSDRESPAVVTGGLELVDDFYDVFCRNMHALGTPVYPRRFFAELLARFPDHCKLVLVRSGQVPMAAGFLVVSGKLAEIPWAACREDAKLRGYNMKLYWECLVYAIARGCTRFDFGRSTAGSGTFRFKSQWGARPVQLHWHRWDFRNSNPAPENPTDGRLRRTVGEVWKRLPLAVANFAGPLISPRLPW